MPIEIKELHIKAAVSDGMKEAAISQMTKEDLIKLKKEIISEVTENIFRALQQKNER